MTTSVTVTVAPLAIVPILQSTIRLCGRGVQVPCVDVAEPNPVFFGSVSVTVTPVAVAGPLFVALMMYVICWPT